MNLNVPYLARKLLPLCLLLLACSEACFADTPPFTQAEMSGGEIADGLDVGSIRLGSHSTYDRLVFDVTYWEGAAEELGEYAEKPGHFSMKPLLMGVEYSLELGGFRAFSAPMPKFSADSRLSSISRRRGEAFEDDSTISLLIRFQSKQCYRVFTLVNPARIVLDVGECQ